MRTFFILLAFLMTMQMNGQKNKPIIEEFRMRGYQPAHNPATPLILYDSVYSWKKDSNSFWQNFIKKDGYTYDENHQLLGFTIKKFNGGAWTDSMKVNYTYQNGNIIGEVRQWWNGSSWENLEKVSYSYNDKALMTKYTLSGWSGSYWLDVCEINYNYDLNNNLTNWIYKVNDRRGWSNAGQVLFQYDTSGNLTLWEQQLWFNDTWIGNYKYTIIYDAQSNPVSLIAETWLKGNYVPEARWIATYTGNNIQQSLTEETWGGTEWINNVKNEYYYVTDNDLIRDVCFKWIDDHWDTIDNTVYTYDESRMLSSVLSKSKNNGQWINSRMKTFFYNASKKEIFGTEESWIDNAWFTTLVNSYAYDDNDLMLAEALLFFDDVTGNIIISDSVRYYFHTVSGVDEILSAESGVLVYPNPGKSHFTILSMKEVQEIMVCDITGKTVPVFNRFTGHGGENGSTFRADIEIRQSPGTYLVKVISGRNITPKTIIVQ